MARDCAVMGQAVTLARWIGADRKRVTEAGQVLRRPDVPAAAAALGLRVPAKIRTAADIPALNRPWCVAVAVGLLELSKGTVTGGPMLAHWPAASAEDAEEVLAGWLSGLRAVCSAESDPMDKDGMRLLALALLRVLSTDDLLSQQLVFAELGRLCDLYDKSLWQVDCSAYRYRDGDGRSFLPRLIALLAEFGAVTSGPGKPVITPLGRWATEHLAVDLPVPADPELPAAELIAAVGRFDDEKQRRHIATDWLAQREATDAVREILAAAERLPARSRCLAIEIAKSLGEEALPAWREQVAAPLVGPHARAVVADWVKGRGPREADRRWLAVEAAVAMLAKAGPDEALSRVQESMPGADLAARLAAVRATGHPDAAELARVIAEFDRSGAPRSIDQVAQLKVSLADFRPPIWRRVLLPATASLGDLHNVIQTLYGWDGAHRHIFTVGKKQYSGWFYNHEETLKENELRVRDALSGDVKKIMYEYDLGPGWQHEITLERILPREPGRQYPVWLDFAGDFPVEYWSEEDPEEPEPFSIAAVNRSLAKFVGAS
jgi:Plasmid pRiA4b ORF-3-like protein